MPDNTNTSANSGANTLKGTSRFAYPFPLIDSAGDIQDYFAKLAQADDGFYPLGVNGQFHGGVHFDERTNAELEEDQKGIRCIADGEVIAYRINEQDLEANFGDDENPRVAYYSNAFVLVRHKFEAPKSLIPPPAAVAGAPATPAPVMPSIFLYSLYMHLENYEAYEGADKETPKFWKPDPVKRRVLKDSINLRSGSSTSSSLVMTLSRGATLTLEAGEGIGNLKFRKIASIESGGTMVENTEHWVSDTVLTAILAPEAMNSVFIPATPIPIKAGELIGHLGNYMRRNPEVLGNIPERKIVHIELFAGDDLPKFVSDCRALAANCPQSQKTMLEIKKGAKLVLPDNTEDGVSATNLRVGAHELSEVAFTHALNIKNVEKTLKGTDGKRWFRVEVSAQADEEHIGSVHTHHGWAREEGHRGVKLCSPWAFPGFEMVEFGTVTPAELTVLRLLEAPVAIGSVISVPDIAKPVVTAGKKLFSVIDTELEKIFQLIDTNNDRELSLPELRAAFSQTRWLGQTLSKRIVKNNSEWGNPISVVDETISKVKILMEGLAEEEQNRVLNEWDVEKARIETLLWWNEVKGKNGFLTNHKVYHIHPIAMAGNFGGGCCKELTAEILKAIASGVTNARATLYTPHFIEMFERFGFKECITKAHILAQVLHESGQLQYTKELGQNLSYDPWRGRGLLQITFRENYSAYGNYIGEDFTSSQTAREGLESAPHAVTSIGWFWSVYKNLTRHSDGDDFIYCTAVVNGAYNGYNHRLQFLNRAVEVMGMQGHLKKNRNGVYLFEESAVYNSPRYSFAWGLWHDTGSNKQGVTKDAEKAIAGYRRFLQIDAEQATASRSWYGLTPKINDQPNPNARVQWYRNYATNRIAALGGS